MSAIKVPFNKACILGTEVGFIQEAMSNAHLAGGGVFNKKSEALLTELMGKPSFLCTSATHALEMTGLLLEIKEGDEVIVPSFTFVSTANAYVLRGAKIRFVENDSFGNIDLAACERAMNSKTKAVLAVHYAGNSTDMDALVSLCRKHGVALVEDAAQCMGSTYKGKPLGTFGDLGCISFHDTKNITCGEGGALVVNNPALIERAEILREKGTNRKKFLMGLVDKYSWVDVGSSYVLSELNAAYLYPQLQALSTITQKRVALAKRYHDALATPLGELGIEVLKTPSHNTSNGHIFGFLFRNTAERGEFISYMKERSVLTPFHYVALHTSNFGKKFFGEENLKSQDFKNCNRFSDCLVRLPLYYNMTDVEQNYVIESVLGWLKNHAKA